MCGNSLVGARRQVYEPAGSLASRRFVAVERWFNFAPERVKARGRVEEPSTTSCCRTPAWPTIATRPRCGTKPTNFNRVKATGARRSASPSPRKSFAELEALSARVDELWALHTEQLGRDRRETEDTLPVWGHRRERPVSGGPPTIGRIDIREQGVFSEGTRTVGPYRRLKLVMDYWCALWFWPIGEAESFADQGRIPERG